MDKYKHVDFWNHPEDFKQPESVWIFVYFNCLGWDGVTTSIPESEKQNAKEYLEKQGYKAIENLTFDQQTFFDNQKIRRHGNSDKINLCESKGNGSCDYRG